MIIKSKFGRALKLIREAKGFTQEDFVGILSRTHMSVLETGKKGPNIETMSLLAQRLGISLTLFAFIIESVDSPDSLKNLTNTFISEVESFEKLIVEIQF